MRAAWVGPCSPAPKIAGTVCTPTARGSSTVPAAIARRVLRAYSTAVSRPSMKWPHTESAAGISMQSTPWVAHGTNWHARGRCGTTPVNIRAK